MGWIPTVTLFKGSRRIRVNADDTLRHCREGWSREDPNEPKGKKEMTPDEKTAEQIIQDELLKAEPEVPAINLDDLQA